MGDDNIVLQHFFHHFLLLPLFCPEVRVPGKKMVFAQSRHITLHPVDLILLELLLNFTFAELFIAILNDLATLTKILVLRV